MKKFLIVPIFIILSGCSVKNHTINSYDLSVENSHLASKHYNKVLQIRYPNALNALGSSKIFYKRDGITSYYLYSHWNSPLNKIIYSELLKNLLNSKKYRAVVGYNSGAKVDLILETNIIDFYHIVNGNSSYAKIAISAKLIDASSNKIIKSRVFNYKLNVKKLNAKEFVKTAQRAVDMFVKDLISSF